MIKLFIINSCIEVYIACQSIAFWLYKTEKDKIFVLKNKKKLNTWAIDIVIEAC